MVATVRQSQRLNQLLKLAALSGATNTVRDLIRRGADVNAEDDGGHSALMLAAVRGHVGTCHLLCESGADLGLANHKGRTALSLAREFGGPKVTELLEYYRGRAKDSGDVHSSQDSYGTQVDVSPPECHGVVDNWMDAEEVSPLRSDASANLDVWSAIQAVMSDHSPLDTDPSWDDVEIELPDTDLELPKSEQLNEAAICDLFVEGLRHGSVSRADVATASCHIDGNFSQTIKVCLMLALQNLRVRVDDDGAASRGLLTEYASNTSKRLAQALLIANWDFVSLDDPEVIRSFEAEVPEQLIDPVADPDELATAEAFENAIASSLELIPSKYGDIIRLRFGLTDGDEHTIEEAGIKFNLTPEEIRQIELQALQKLRDLSISSVFHIFFDHIEESAANDPVSIGQRPSGHLKRPTRNRGKIPHLAPGMCFAESPAAPIAVDMPTKAKPWRLAGKVLRNSDTGESFEVVSSPYHRANQVHQESGGYVFNRATPYLFVKGEDVQLQTDPWVISTTNTS